jgi:hypothetical protein
MLQIIARRGCLLPYEYDLRAVTLQFDSKRSMFLSLLDVLGSFLSCRQATDQLVDSYAVATSHVSMGGSMESSEARLQNLMKISLWQPASC